LSPNGKQQNDSGLHPTPSIRDQETDLIRRRRREALHVRLPLVALRRRELGHVEHDVHAEVPERGEVRLLPILPSALERRAPALGLVDRPRKGDRDGAWPGSAPREAAVRKEVEERLPRERRLGRGDGGGVSEGV
jgi:hypothetical protein